MFWRNLNRLLAITTVTMGVALTVRYCEQRTHSMLIANLQNVLLRSSASPVERGEQSGAQQPDASCYDRQAKPKRWLHPLSWKMMAELKRRIRSCSVIPRGLISPSSLVTTVSWFLWFLSLPRWFDSSVCLCHLFFFFGLNARLYLGKQRCWCVFHFIMSGVLAVLRNTALITVN